MGQNNAQVKKVFQARPVDKKALHADCYEALRWENFLGRHDMKWNSLPELWDQGALLGNGLMGATVYSKGSKELQWDIGRTDVIQRWEENPGEQCRLPIGKLMLHTEGTILNGRMRLNLWDAEVTGTIETDKGTLVIRSFIHSEGQILVVEVEATGAEKDCTFVFKPSPAVNPGVTRQLAANQPDVVIKVVNPEVVEKSQDTMKIFVQSLTTGGDYTTALQVVELSNEKKVAYLSVGYSYPEAGSEQEAVQWVNGALDSGLEPLVNTHRQWWHHFYPQSFISFPDAVLESLYWIQIYKLASATRPEYPIVDTMGPWYFTTKWPRVWFNLNIQLTYWPVYASNRLALGESLCRTLDENLPNLIRNVPEEYRYDSAAIGRSASYDLRRSVGEELGDLTWTLHNYWLQYRHSMDDEMLKNRLYPLLRRSINFYLHLLSRGEDGKLHLPVALSPEYNFQKGPDTNYDLALLRWGCTALLETCSRLGIQDELIPKWQEVLENLVEYPVDENGMMIASGVPFENSHRHYSHLLMFYPLHLMDLEDLKTREVYEKSIRHWMGMPQALRGYSYTGAAAMFAHLGNGNEALENLHRFAEKFLKPNTLYLEGSPVIETPLSAAASIHELLLFYWSETIYVFNAIPDDWKDVVIHNMRTEGAFLVSGVRRDGKTRFIKITSLAGEPCKLKTNMNGPFEAMAERETEIRQLDDGALEIDLKKGETIVIYPEGTTPDLTIEPTQVTGPTNFYGTGKIQAGYVQHDYVEQF